MAIVVPTLAHAGWLRAIAEKADTLFAHFYESDKLQSVIYGKNVSSLQHLIEQHGHDTNAIVQNLRTTLEMYLGRHFDSASVHVTASSTNSDGEETGKIQLRVYCRVMEDGKDYSFGKLIVAMNSKLEKVIALNNGELESV